ncbi:MFS transporter [Streptomyces sp. NPDC051173]|uniref:MFS transporter n=1 Tax=Streptomyces sp. NPDC051173 TaxID=3155164 RepID=UPI00344D214C
MPRPSMPETLARPQLAASAAKDSTKAPAKALIASILLALFLSAIDSTAVGALLPTIAHGFGYESLYPWLISGFLLASVLAVPFAGLAADRWGSRAAMTVALGWFAASSLAVALVTDMPSLIAARAAQGVGAGGVTALSYVLIGQAFGNAGRAKMQGLLSSVWGLAAVAGPLLGTAVQVTVGWRWLFAANVPLAAVAVAMILKYGPSSRSQAPGKGPDRVALTTFAAALTAFLLLLVGPTLHLRAWSYGVLAAILVAAVMAHVRRLRTPGRTGMVPADFAVRPAQRNAGLVTIGAAVTLYASVTLLPLALTSSGSASSGTAGLLVAPGALGWVVGSALTARLLQQRPARTIAIGGAFLLALGAGILTGFPGTSVAATAVAELLIGVGTGLVTSTALVHVQNAAPAHLMGAHTSTVTLLRNLGAAIGVNLLATVQTTAARNIGGLHAEADAYRIAFAVLTALAVLTILAAGRLRQASTRD